MGKWVASRLLIMSQCAEASKTIELPKTARVQEYPHLRQRELQVCYTELSKSQRRQEAAEEVGDGHSIIVATHFTQDIHVEVVLLPLLRACLQPAHAEAASGEI